MSFTFAFVTMSRYDSAMLLSKNRILQIRILEHSYVLVV